jgi:hypothetical protein
MTPFSWERPQLRMPKMLKRPSMIMVRPLARPSIGTRAPFISSMSILIDRRK